jgi:integrase/recombinase XerD
MDINNNEITVFKNSELTSTVKNVNKQELRKYMNKDEINEIIKNIPVGKEKMAIITLWMTGLRSSELLSITKGDIDFQNKTLKIEWLKSRKMHHRIIPLKSELVNILQVYTVGLINKDRVFPFTRQWLFKIVKKWFKSSPHTLRHSFAVNFLRQSDNPTALVILQRLLGHGRIQTTMEYLKIVPSDMAIELNKIVFD